MKGLREARRRKKLSQSELAAELHVTRETISYYENGKRNPDIPMLLALSEYFNVSVHYLITGSEFIPREEK